MENKEEGAFSKDNNIVASYGTIPVNLSRKDRPKGNETNETVDYFS